MKCIQCSADNSDNAKFCTKCGATLAANPKDVPCPSCGVACKPGVKFCTKCGHGLGSSESAGPAPALTPSQSGPPPTPETSPPGSNPPRQAAQSSPAAVESKPSGRGIGAKIAIGVLATLAALFFLGLVGQFNNNSGKQSDLAEAPAPASEAPPPSGTEAAPISDTGAASATEGGSLASLGDQGSSGAGDGAAEPLEAAPFITPKPSFDCSIAATQSEKLICSDAELAELDVRLARAYSVARDRATDGAAFKAVQIDWIMTVRDQCPDVACMSAAISERTKELESQ